MGTYKKPAIKNIASLIDSAVTRYEETVHIDNITSSL